jgi:hypothetical protein
MNASLLRALKLPFQMASLMFVALIGVINAIAGGPPTLSPTRMFVLFVMLSWLNKYAFALLELAANGSRHAPVASVEQLGPLGDHRVWIHPTYGAAIAFIYTAVDAPAGPAISAAIGLVMPASLIALAVSPRTLDAFNPLMFARIVAGLGGWYFALLAAAATCVAACWALYDAPGPQIVRFMTAELLVLCLYAFIGGVTHLRRLELAFDPVSSPEREAERLARAQNAIRQKALDDFYGAIRARDAKLAGASLQPWLTSAAGARMSRDLEYAIEQSRSWPEGKGLATLLQAVVVHALSTRQPALAIQAATAGVDRVPGFCVANASELETLVHYARQSSRKRLAVTLLDNFTRSMPGPLPDSLAALRRDLGV